MVNFRPHDWMRVDGGGATNYDVEAELEKTKSRSSASGAQRRDDRLWEISEWR